MSIHETWMRSVDEELLKPESFKVYADLLRRMRAREFDPLVAVVTQGWREGLDFYDAYAFGQVYAELRLGRITITPIHLGASPSSDDQFHKNAEKLARVQSPFKADLKAGRGDADGSLMWCEEILLGEHTLVPQQVPLEVGYTRPLTTLWHLHQERGLARWPYEHEQLWLLKVHARGMKL